MEALILSLAVLAVAELIYHLWRHGWPDDRAARETVEEFARKFPGRCMICSMHRYGYTHGHERDPQPKPHPCIERKGATWPKQAFTN